MRRFLGETLTLFFTGLLYGIVASYLIYHSKTGLAAEDPHTPLGQAVIVGFFVGLGAVVTGLLLRVFPLLPVARVFFAPLVGAFVFAVFLGTREPNKDVPGTISLGATLGFFVGLIEASRQARIEKRPPSG